MNQQLTVAIADDHELIRLGIKALLGQYPHVQVVGEAADGDGAVELVRRLAPQILLLDLMMPRLPGLETIRELTADRATGTKIILLTSAISEKEVLEALQLGARGVLLKNQVSTDLVSAVEAVSGGDYFLRGRVVTNLVGILKELIAETTAPPAQTFGLSPRELEVVVSIVEGGTNRDIAHQLNISEETVKRHLTNIFDKTGVSTRLELAMFAVHHRLAQIEAP